jgi:hypothetical protein
MTGVAGEDPATPVSFERRFHLAAGSLPRLRVSLQTCFEEIQSRLVSEDWRVSAHSTSGF